MSLKIPSTPEELYMLELEEKERRLHDYKSAPATKGEVHTIVREELKRMLGVQVPMMSTMLMVLSETLLDKGIITTQDMDATKQRLVESGMLMKLEDPVKSEP